MLALTGIFGRATYDFKGFPSRFPPLVDRIFDYRANGAESPRLQGCFYQLDEARYSLDEERRRAAGFFEAQHCAAISDPRKPTIVILGDLHAAHLFTGLQEVYGAKANLLTLSSVFCVPLVENVAMDQGVAGTPRCRAINDYVFDAIRTIKPDVVIVGGYFAQYDHEANWRYPGFSTRLSPARGACTRTAWVRSSSPDRFRHGLPFCPSSSAVTFSSATRRRNSHLLA